MLVLNKFTLRSAPLALLALFTAPGAFAETLIYVTSSTIGTVDSSNPSADNTSGGNGPLSYALPNGYSTIGAKVSIDAQELYLLASNGNQCQLFSADTSAGGGLNAVDASFSCSFQSGSADFAFLSDSGTGSETDAYVIADGQYVLKVPAGGTETPTSYSITTPSGGGEGNIQGIVDVGTAPNQVQYGVDATTQELVQLQFNLSNGIEGNLGSLKKATFFGSTSLDYSAATGNIYLDADGQLYSLDLSTFPTTGAVNPLGAVPEGTVAIVAPNGVSVNNNGGNGGGGGALAPAVLLPLAAMAALRRRKPRASA